MCCVVHVWYVMACDDLVYEGRLRCVVCGICV